MFQVVVEAVAVVAEDEVAGVAEDVGGEDAKTAVTVLMYRLKYEETKR